MKKTEEKGIILLKSAVLLTAVYFCALETALVKSAVTDGIDRCLSIVIPSLYAMMIVSVMIVKSGILSCIPRFAGSIGRMLFGMGAENYAVFVFSMFAGYPAGAKIITEQYSSGKITSGEASLLCGVCFGAGPAFIMGCISGTLYGSGTAGKIIIISTISANILTAFAVSFFLRKSRNPAEASHRPINISGSLLTESVISAGRTIGELCFMITAFSVITAMLERMGAVSAAAGIFSFVSGFSREVSEAFIPAVLDITAVRGLPADNYALLPWICALVSSGGICVIFQTAAIIAGRFPLRKFILLRCTASVLSFGICRLILPFMLRDEIIAVSSVNIGTYSAPSPVPSVMLLLMTFIIMAEYDKIVKIQK